MRRRILAALVLTCLAGCASPAQVEFRAAGSTNAPGSVRMTDPFSGTTIYVTPQVVVSNADIQSASVGSTESGMRAVNVTLTDAGANKLLAYTKAHIGEPIAILVDGKLVSAPVVFSPISKAAVIMGGPNGLSQQEADRIVASLSQRRSDSASKPNDA